MQQKITTTTLFEYVFPTASGQGVGVKTYSKPVIKTENSLTVLSAMSSDAESCADGCF